MSHRFNRTFGSIRSLAAILLATFATVIYIGSAAAAPKDAQGTFGSPEEAVQALVGAAKTDNVDAIINLFGASSRDWIISGDDVQDAQTRQRFVTAYAQKSAIEMRGGDKAVLSVGDDGFPFPFPLVRKAGRWSFDAAAGKEELLNRQIGRDELNTIEAMRAIVDAQREYAAIDRGVGHVPEYAQKFRSSPGKKDGLYWPAGPGETESPLGPLFADAVKAGYRVPTENAGPIPYQGYYFRILTGQGDHAPGGAYDYVAKDKMIGGFAVLAYPAKYGISGVKSFMVSHDGDVYEGDLGRQTTQAAGKIRKFDPGNGWSKVSED
jgi:Protein of unknown function (DUF2950)